MAIQITKQSKIASCSYFKVTQEYYDRQKKQASMILIGLPDETLKDEPTAIVLQYPFSVSGEDYTFNNNEDPRKEWYLKVKQTEEFKDAIDV